MQLSYALGLATTTLGRGNPSEPAGVFVVDLKSNNGRTSVEAALQLLKDNSIQVPIDLPYLRGADAFMLNTSGLGHFDAGLDDYESRYLTKAQAAGSGRRGVVSANFKSSSTSLPAADIIFNDTVFGN